MMRPLFFMDGSGNNGFLKFLCYNMLNINLLYTFRNT